MMKKNASRLLLLCLIIFSVSKGAWTQYAPVEAESVVQFKIKNFGINTSGSFKGLQGNINFDSKHPENAVFDVTVNANTINTDNEMRDNHLRGETYFDVNKFPTIHFVSSAVSSFGNTGAFLMSGKLTIKNQTKDIEFPFTAEPQANAFLFKGAFTINRKEFGIGGASVISDELQVELSVMAKKQKIRV